MAYKSQPTVTRPANVTAYTAGDVVGGAFARPELYAARALDLLITSTSLRIDVAAIPAGMTSFREHFYAGTPPSAIADNSAWDLPAGDRAFYLGYIDHGSPADTGSTLFCKVDNQAAQLQIPAGATVYSYLVTNGAFTPAGNSEVYVPTIHAIDAA